MPAMRAWLRETHGPNFELLRHFLLRFFDSDMVTAPGQTATALIGAFSIFLPWFPTIVGPLRHKYAVLFQPGDTRAVPAGRTRRRTVADHFDDVRDRTPDGGQVAIAVSGIERLSGAGVAAITRAADLRGEIAGATGARHGGGDHVQSVARPDVSECLDQPLGVPTIRRRTNHGARRGIRGGVLFLLFWNGRAARCAAEPASPKPVCPGDGVFAGIAGGSDGDTDRPEFLHTGSNHQHRNWPEFARWLHRFGSLGCSNSWRGIRTRRCRRWRTTRWRR